MPSIQSGTKSAPVEIERAISVPINTPPANLHLRRDETGTTPSFNQLGRPSRPTGD
ncbi:hypothetical protein [Novipirellula aureliae]|uniref:hypothetical protein n=1 Tax=Novipirellula aureliae TaxID=2527966 RepID=UPI0018CF5E1E|nr:hypothetical protein [Novipirellula aureliae]